MPSACNDNWQLDGAVSWNDAQTDGATTLVFGEDDDGKLLGFTVQDGARLPLTPDWSATLGIEYRSSGQLFDAQPFARFDFAYVGESVNSLEGIESVVSGNPPVVQDAYETGDLRIGLDGGRLERVVLRRQRLGRARGALLQQPLGRAAAAVGQPAADLRAAAQVQVLTAS